MTRFIHTEQCFALQTPYKYTLAPWHYTTSWTGQFLPIGKFNMGSVMCFWCIFTCWPCQLVEISTLNPCMKKRKTTKWKLLCLTWIQRKVYTNKTCWWLFLFQFFWDFCFIHCKSKHIFPCKWAHLSPSLTCQLGAISTFNIWMSCNLGVSQHIECSDC